MEIVGLMKNLSLSRFHTSFSERNDNSIVYNNNFVYYNNIVYNNIVYKNIVYYNNIV